MPSLPRFPIIDGLKQCSRCGLAKPVSDFYEVRKGTDRYFAACKPCTVAQQMVSPRRLPYQRLWQEDHRDRVRAANNASYAKNASQWAERERQRWIDDPEWRMRKTASTNNARRGRAYAALIDVVSIRDIGVRDGWTCQLCGQPVDPGLLEHPDQARINPGYPTIDHIQPFSVATDGCKLRPGDNECPHGCRGGFTVMANLQLAHGRCNKRKSTHLQ